MNSLILDSQILTCPVESEGEEALLSYLNNLLDWRKIKEMNSLDVFLSSETAELLSESNGYPHWEKLSQVIGRHDLGIMPKDIMDIVRSFLAKVPTIEDELQMLEIICENSSCSPSANIEIEQRNKKRIISNF